MFKYKKISLLLTALSVIGLSSCGGPSATDIVNEAAGAATILTEDFQRTKGQLQVISQVVVTVGEEEIAVPLTWTADTSTSSLWEFSEPSKRNIIYCTPDLPEVDEEQVSFTLTATATYKKKVATKTFEGVLMPTAPIVTRTIASLDELDIEANVSVVVKGVIRTIYAGNNNAAVCDVTGCIGIYARNGLDIYDSGQTVIIKGNYGANKKPILDPSTPGGTGVYEEKLVVPQIYYTSMEVVDGRFNEIPLEGITPTTYSELSAYDPNKFTKDDFENISAREFKLDAKIFKYDGGGFHVWEMIPVNSTSASSFIGFYCNSNAAGALQELDEYMEAFEGKNVEVVAFVYDMQAKVNKGNTWRFSPLYIKLK